MTRKRLDSARAALLALQARFDAGAVAPSDYERERRAIERGLGDALVDAGAASRPSSRLVAGLAIFIVGVAAIGYAFTGSPRAGIGAPAVGAVGEMAAAASDVGASGAGTATGDPRQAGLAQIAAMVDSLAARMKERPDDGEGWTMLARSYTVLGRFAEAVPAYRRAVELQPTNAGILADYADAVAAMKGSVGNPESLALIDRALAIDPRQPKALALSGTAAYDRGDFAGAIGRWQTIADNLPPQSELLAQVKASIVEAREHLGGAASAVAPVPVGKATTASPNIAVAGTVTIDPALAAKAAPGDSVFVFARATDGPRMPLAVLRARVADLPLTFKLDDSMAMSPTAKLSGARSVMIGARVSKSGNATPQPGDFAGESSPVAPGASGVTVRIGDVVAAR